ncbi:Pkinase-domain-containing protein [Mycena kentingensis (nom. inval.)]|nr:Pkinase-domain-containing protein [Mycena kentingensis (nom. inval.)]
MDGDEPAYDLMETQPSEATIASSPANKVDDQIWGYLNPCMGLAVLKRIDLFKNKPTVNIGRHLTNDYILPGFKISNFHATIAWDAEGASTITLLDKSSNGTFGNQVLLKDGQEVAFGIAGVSYEDNGRFDYRYIFRDFVTAQAKRAVFVAYDLGPQLGKGSFATVFKALHRQSGTLVAIKCIHEARRPSPCAAGSTGPNPMFSREIKIMEELRHPNICSLREVFRNTNGSIDLVLELVMGGDLLDYILDRNGLPEPVAQNIAYQLCQALSYIHSKGITHRDLKPENVLMTTDSPPIVKVADFGLAKIVDSMTMLKTMCGTPSYLAPEVVTQQNQSGYDSLVDSWSVGVILFSMLTNTTPFIENSSDDLRTKIATRIIDWEQLDAVTHRDPPDTTPIPISAEVKDMARRLLDYDPQQRLRLSDALHHPWFDGIQLGHDFDYPDTSGGTPTLERDASMRSIATTFSVATRSDTDAVSQRLRNLRINTNGAGQLVPDPKPRSDNGDVPQQARSNGNTPPPEKPPLPRLHTNGLNRRKDVLEHAQATNSKQYEPSWEMVAYMQSQLAGEEVDDSPPQTTTAEASGSKTPTGVNGKGKGKRARSDLTPLPEERNINGAANGDPESSPLSSPPQSDGEDVDEGVRVPARKRGRGAGDGAVATPTTKRRAAARGSGAGKASASGSRKGRGSKESAGDATPVTLRRSTRPSAAKAKSGGKKS